MRFQHLDLNLLVALDVLLEEQNITRAAARLHMTQSAASGVLGRLRAYFDDDLLVQVGRKMLPTPLARELALPVREVLMKIQSSITAKPVFDPATSKRHFRLFTSDYVISVLFASVIRRLAGSAPHVTLEVLALNETSFEALARGEVDLMVIPDRYLVDDYPAEQVFEEEQVCVVWADNTQVGDSLTLEDYLELGHISVGFGRNRLLSIEDWFMSQYGCNRRIEVITHDFNTLPQLVVGTQRIATMHRRLAELYARAFPLRILPTPVPLPTVREFMMWHRSMDRDPTLRWLREQILETARSPAFVA